MEAKLTRSLEKFQNTWMKGSLSIVFRNNVHLKCKHFRSVLPRVSLLRVVGTGDSYIYQKGLHAFHNQSVKHTRASCISVNGIPNFISFSATAHDSLSKCERWLVLNALSVYPPAIKSTKWVVGFGVAWSLGELGETFLRTLRSKGQTS